MIADSRVTVAANETLGPLAVDVTIHYGATTQVLTVHGTIVPPDSN